MARIGTGDDTRPSRRQRAADRGLPARCGLPVSANKFGARKVEVGGYTFASKAEARRYEELRMLVLAGEIRDLVVHPGFALYVPSFSSDRPGPDCDEAPVRLALCYGTYGPGCEARKIGMYHADFAYWTNGGWGVVEDVKGGNATRTEAYRLRKKMVEISYGIKITEVQM